MSIVGNAFRRNAKYLTDKRALSWAGGSRTWGELYTRTNRLAQALSELGLRKGDHVSLLLKNQPEFVESFLACHLLGTPVTPNNVRYKAAELVYQLGNSDARILLFDSSFLPLIQAVRAELPNPIQYICVDRPANVDWARSYEELVVGAAALPSLPEVVDQDLGYILYTSGTTGRAKGAMITYSGMAHLLFEVSLDVGLGGTDVSLAASPLYHIAGHGFLLLAPLLVGAEVILLPDFSPAAFLEIVQRHRVTWTFLVPTMAAAILQLGDKIRDVASLRKVLFTGAVLPQKIKLDWAKTFPDVLMWENYGSTEMGNVCRLGPARIIAKDTSCGMPVLTQDVRLLSPSTNHDVPPGEVGEVCVKGATVIQGYYKNAAETEKTIVGGWFHSGDLGRLDEDGYLYIVDRVKDLIISGGVNIYPIEVEAVLISHPAVAAVAVIGLPDDYWGEAVTAIIVPKAGTSVTEPDIISFCGDRLADFKKPKRVFFTDTLPLTGSGKVLKHELRAQYRSRQQ